MSDQESIPAVSPQDAGEPPSAEPPTSAPPDPASAVPPTSAGRLRALRFLVLYHEHMTANRRRERLFLASVGFFVAAIGVRLLTHAIRANIGPFRNVVVGGTHLHHLVWGILILLVVGYVWLAEVGTADPRQDLLSRVTAMAFGVGAALTLDEFALWLNLNPDDYWSRQGRESVEALLVMAGLLSAFIWAGPLIRTSAREFALLAAEARAARRRLNL